MNHLRSTTFSVFVGHIQPGTTKKDLLDLFSGCGPVAELVILEKEGQSYNYGFVRYREVAHIHRAVAELNRWRMNGCELVVDISKDTAQRIEQEKLCPDKMGEVRAPVAPRAAPRAGPVSHASRSVKDMMYLNRLRETCVLMNLTDSPGEVNTGRLMEDLHKKESGLVSLWGTPALESSSIKEVSCKVKQSCPSSVSDAFHVFVETLVSDIRDVAEAEELNTSTSDAEQTIEAALDEDAPAETCTKLTLKNDTHLLKEELTPETLNTHLFKAAQTRQVERGISDPEKIKLTESSDLCVNIPAKSEGGTSKESITLSKQEARLIKMFRLAKPFLEQADDEFDHYMGELGCGSEAESSVSEKTVEPITVRSDSLTKPNSEPNLTSMHPQASAVNHRINEVSLVQDSQVNVAADKSNKVEATCVEYVESVDSVTFMDPAVVDFHVSSVTSPEKESSKSEVDPTRIGQIREGSTVLNELFANIKTDQTFRKGSGSSDSNVSEGSNEGSVEDSGFESDNLAYLMNKQGPYLDQTARIDPGRLPCGRGAQLSQHMTRAAGVRAQGVSWVYQRGIGRQSLRRRPLPEPVVGKRPVDLEELIKKIGRGRNRHTSLR